MTGVIKSHPTVGFMARHLVISKVRGQFQDYEATIQFDGDEIAASSMRGTIQVASIDTGHAKRDKHWRRPDFFDADQFPQITFASRSIQKQGDGYVMIGDLTMRGVTKEIALPFSLVGPITHGKKTRIGFEAELEINRQDYGISYSKVADTGGLVVSDTIRIEINGEAIKQE